MTPQTLKKIIISIFILINLTAVFFSNRPAHFIEKANAYIKEEFLPIDQYRLNYAAWCIKRYAYFVGLNHFWSMFGRQLKYNWNLAFKGIYDDGEEVFLETPSQSTRTFIESRFVDIKEQKMLANLLRGGDEYINRYSRYLCRHFDNVEGKKLNEIKVESHYRYFYTPQEAEIHGSYSKPESYTNIMMIYDCKEKINRRSTY